MELIKAGTRPTLKARADYFTGTVWQDPIIEAPAPAALRALRVSFEPGARTAWHTHPLGQTLYVVSGVGRVALRDAVPRVIRPGDTIWIPPGVEHWHGAAPDTGMVHIAMQEAKGGRVSDWLELVSEAEYLKEADEAAEWLEEVVEEESRQDDTETPSK